MATKIADTTEVPAKDAGTNGRGGMKLLDFDSILAADDIKTDYAPAWGGTVKVIGLTGEQRAKVFAAITAHGKQIKDEDAAQAMFYAFVIAASLVDEDNQHIAKLSDAPRLTQKNGAELSRVYRVCARLSGLGDEEEKKALDDLKATPSASSGTD